MPEYEVQFARSARKELEKLDDAVAIRILDKIESLGKNPYPRESVKIRTTEDLRRIRVGMYRILYTVNDERYLVDIAAIRHRRDAYQQLP